MKNEYSTVVCPNGRIVKFRQRDQGSNRFKAFIVSPSGSTMRRELEDFIEANSPGLLIRCDDCNGEDLATLLRLVMESGDF